MFHHIDLKVLFPHHSKTTELACYDWLVAWFYQHVTGTTTTNAGDSDNCIMENSTFSTTGDEFIEVYTITACTMIHCNNTVCTTSVQASLQQWTQLNKYMHWNKNHNAKQMHALEKKSL